MTFYEFLIGLGVVVALLVAGGSALWWIAVTRTKMHRLEEDVRELKTQVINLTIRVNTHIDVMTILRQMRLLGPGERPGNE